MTVSRACASSLQPRREIDRVAGHRVVAMDRAAGVGGDHLAARHADVRGERPAELAPTASPSPRARRRPRATRAACRCRMRPARRTRPSRRRRCACRWCRRTARSARRPARSSASAGDASPRRRARWRAGVDPDKSANRIATCRRSAGAEGIAGAGGASAMPSALPHCGQKRAPGGCGRAAARTGGSVGGHRGDSATCACRRNPFGVR